MAASTRDIRRRIRSIKNTAQITKAMQMVAASKMRRAQQAALAGRPYAELMQKVLASLRGRADPSLHPLLEVRPINKELVVVISSDKGLCGGLNTNLMREAVQFDAAKTVYIAAGKKGLQFLARTKRQILADFELKDAPSFLETKAVSKFAMDQFLTGNVDRVTVLYTKFITTLSQQPVTQTILPINEADLAAESEAARPETLADYIYEPNPQAVLGAILPYYVHFEVYQMVLNARASEHSARMVAMKNATDNANQLIKDLTLEYNKIRQASITTELLEIATAQMALG
jgi:F-type H+-transporting ATPase subunit gamma